MKKTETVRSTGTIALLLTILLSVLTISAQASDTKKKSTAKKPASSAKKSTAGGSSEHARLLDPSKLTAKAPELFTVRFDTSKGPIDIEVHRDWSPNGADRFYNLVKNGFYDGARFYRVIPGFMAQFGFSPDPAVNAAWQPASIADDPVKESNKRGMVSFAMRGPNTRTTQLFINYADQNARLDGMGFSPFGKVITGMEAADALYGGYGEGAPSGGGPSQGRLASEGNTYLSKDFPQLDYIKTAKVATK